jgi:hypothetical protein
VVVRARVTITVPSKVAFTACPAILPQNTSSTSASPIVVIVLERLSATSRPQRGASPVSVLLEKRSFAAVQPEDGARCRFDEVGFDDFKGTLGATQHLIQKGHRRIAFCGDIAYPWIHRRFDGYCQGMQESDLKPVCATAKGPQSFVDFGQDSVPAMLSQKSRPTAIVAGNDEIAYGIWRSLCPPRSEGTERYQPGRLRRSRRSCTYGPAAFNRPCR